MLETDYTFLKNSCLFISLFIILFTGFSCTPDTLWDIPVKTVKEHLKTSQYTFIEDIDFKEKKIADVRILGPGASFYFSSIFNLTGYPEYAKTLLASTWKNGTKLWQDEAGFIFLTELLKEKEYKLLEAHAHKYLKKIKESINLPEVRKLYIEALYWQNKDEAVLAAIHQFFPDTGELYQKDPEITLFQAVAECRLQKKGWEQTFTEFVLQSESSLLHSRAYQFIILDPERFSSFDMGMQQFLLAKSFLATGYLSKALPLIESFIEKSDPEILQKSSIINELGRTYLSLGEHKRGLQFLDTLSKTISGRGNLDALEMAGRITRKDKKYREAALYLKPVYQQTNDPLQRDRAAWFYLDCILELSTKRFLDDMVSYSRQWNDPGYFDD
ncbi:MAG: hypothetical protein JXJ04_05555, partial [Spirochaetales bacterium]|nr:hypothetical protein [Spirochaetales bacterium]